MQKIGNITNTADINGEWTNGNVAGGVPPTIIDAGWLNTIQRELANIVQSAGLALNPAIDTQVLAAIQALFIQKANNLSEIKAAGSAAQTAALANLGSTDGTLKGRLLNVQVFVSSAIYSATPGTTNVIVEVQAAGGPGGGAAATGAGAVSMGTGGTAGAYGKGRYASGFNGVSVIIGAGGVPLAGGTGTAGGNSSFGSLLSCPGGSPGARRGPTAPPFSVTGAPTGALPTGANIQASSGSPGGISFAVSTLLVAPGAGGSSQLGGGGSLNGVGINGNNGISPGSAGSGQQTQKIQQ
ncbi:hypothetical protein GTU79_21080 [Sodalis ligni]|nr:hypothetical protein [Sodalis ligni]QWA09783.1 hypothetical protein GTU79_21080 [Sodalis ligni]